MNSRWYVIQTKPKKEASVFHQLKPRYEMYFPKLKGPCGEKSLFPSYLFIRADFEDPENHRLVQFTRGVRRVLGDSLGPQPIDDLIVQFLIEKTRHGTLSEQALLLREGDEVRVKKGILRDLYGIVEKNLPETGRVRVLLKWWRASMKAVMNYSELEKAA